MALKRFNILIAGVGGQGLLTLGELIGNAAIESGVDVTVAEVHGLSQRGGSVVVHVRLGPGSSPVIPKGAADLIIGLEAIETARYIDYASRESLVVMDSFIWPPPLSKHPSLKQIVGELSGRVKLFVIDASRIAREELKAAVAANVVLLGYSLALSKEFRNYVDLEAAVKAVRRVFRGKAVEVNEKALIRGYSEGGSLGVK